jgi:hypothetical protein
LLISGSTSTRILRTRVWCTSRTCEARARQSPASGIRLCSKTEQQQAQRQRQQQERFCSPCSSFPAAATAWEVQCPLSQRHCSSPWLEHLSRLGWLLPRGFFPAASGRSCRVCPTGRWPSRTQIQQRLQEVARLRMLAPLRQSLNDAVLIGARMLNGTQPAEINLLSPTVA